MPNMHAANADKAETTRIKSSEVSHGPPTHPPTACIPDRHRIMFSLASVANGESRDLSIERACANATSRRATEHPTPSAGTGVDGGACGDDGGRHQYRWVCVCVENVEVMRSHKIPIN